MWAPIGTWLLGYLAIGTVLSALFLMFPGRQIWESDYRPYRFTRFWDRVPALLEYLGLVFLAGVLGWSITLPVLIRMWVHERFFDPDAPKLERVFVPQKTDLVRRFTIEEIEALEAVEDPLAASPRLPFGHLNFAWVRFRARLPSHAEFWFYRADRKNALGALQRHEGYAVLKRGRVRDHFKTTCYRIHHGD